MMAVVQSIVKFGSRSRQLAIAKGRDYLIQEFTLFK